MPDEIANTKPILIIPILLATTVISVRNFFVRRFLKLDLIALLNAIAVFFKAKPLSAISPTVYGFVSS